MVRNKALLFLAIFCTAMLSGWHAQAREMDEYSKVKLRSLDKITARTLTFEAEIGSTVKFGPLFIRVQSCRKAPPIEQPESAAFVQVWEVTPDEKAEWVFSGWMFASSPGLSSMDHPIYDVWVLDCMGEKVETVNDEELTTPEDPPENAGEPDNEIIRETL